MNTNATSHSRSVVLLTVSIAMAGFAIAALIYVMVLNPTQANTFAQRLRAASVNPTEQNQAVPNPAITFQDFDIPDVGTQYAPGIHVADSTGPMRITGGPSGSGYFLRLAYADIVPSHNSIAFEQLPIDTFAKIVADFDFRITPGNGQADGLGFAFLNTANFGMSGIVEPQPSLYAGEEPNFANSLGIGFDVHEATGERPEINANHLSLHFDGAMVDEFDAAALDLASGEWLHARIVLTPGTDTGTVSVHLTQCGAPAMTVIDQFTIPNFTPYAGRPYFGARSGGESADHDIDNVYVQYLQEGEDAVVVNHNCHGGSGTYADFDQPDTGTPFALGTHHDAPALGATQIAGGPSGMGRVLRLTYGDGTLTHNSIAFDRTHVGPAEEVVADFAFRIQPENGRADGFGFALLNTATYSTSGMVAPTAVAEEPNFVGSLGIGFDIFQSNEERLEVNDNHISIHYDNKLLREVNVRNMVDLAEGEWIHARIVMRPNIPYTDISVMLTQCGQPTSTVVDQFRVPGLVAYEGRAYFAARSGGLTANHDIDDIRVHFLDGEQSMIQFATGCAAVAETATTVELTVTRVGNVEAAATVNYATISNTATATQDFHPVSGTLTFEPGALIKTIRIPILDDAIDNERAESFAITLSGVRGDAQVGGPYSMKVQIIDDELARREGYWHDLLPSQVVPIHAQLLPTGQMMYWDRHDEKLGWDGHPRLFDPTTNTIRAAAAITYDLFCSGYSFLENGHMLVAGGHVTGTFGEDKMSIYDPFNDKWMRHADMNAGRWYPTAVTLSNGDVLVMGGTFDLEGESAVNTIPQVWETEANRWRTLFGAKHDNRPNDLDYFPIGAEYTEDHPNYYPFLYVTGPSHVFNAGPQQMARYLDTAGLGEWRDVAPSLLKYRDYGSSVMYDNGKVLITGGNPRDPNVNDNPTVVPSDTSEVIELAMPTPAWRQVSSMNYGRRHLNATLLPDGRVFVNGGSSAPGFDNEEGAVLAAEMWDPDTEMWTTMAAQQRYRGYHSIALLLPDGRVLSGGGGHPNPLRGAQHNFEIYSPPYLFKGSRPEITAAPTHVRYGQEFVVETPNGAEIANVNWIRLSAVTHAFNQSQRINRLPFVQNTNGLTITAPTAPELAPPGHYMLFILKADGVPSIAKIIQLQATAPPTATATPTLTPIITVQVTPSATKTPTPVDTVTITPSPTPTATQRPATATVTPTPSETPKTVQAHLPVIQKQP